MRQISAVWGRVLPPLASCCPSSLPYSPSEQASAPGKATRREVCCVLPKKTLHCPQGLSWSCPLQRGRWLSPLLWTTCDH